MKTLFSALALSLILLSGCGENKSEAKAIEASAPVETSAKAKEPVVEKEKEAVQTEKNKAEKQKAGVSTSTPQLSRFYQIFKDGAQISPEGKPMLLVFGQPADPYTQNLQKDVTENESLAKAIREDVTPIYIDAMAQKRHKFMHNGEAMEVDTKTLISIYHIDSTPTLIFTDEKGKSIFIVPGYMPPKQFEVTLQFVKEGAWKGKDRKNGEVYEALKSYYESHGVKVGGPKK